MRIKWELDEYASAVKKVKISRSAKRNGVHWAIFFGLIESTREKRSIVSKSSTISRRNVRKIIDAFDFHKIFFLDE